MISTTSRSIGQQGQMAEQLRVKWLSLLPIAHAHTLFITYQMTKDADFKGVPESEIHQKAWEAQLTGMPTILREINVNKECLEVLEEEMFMRTERTWSSGNWQWGLDMGHHQDGWDPTFGVPETWDEKKREGGESEHEVRQKPVRRSHYSCEFTQFGLDYIYFKTPPLVLNTNNQIRTRPKPHPIKKSKLSLK